MPNLAAHGDRAAGLESECAEGLSIAGVRGNGRRLCSRPGEPLQPAQPGVLQRANQAPAAALRSAQLALKKERRFSTPYAWAGFVLHGDWGPIAASAGASGSESKRIAIDPRN